MNHIEKLTRLNVELEGLLHVLAKRDTADLRKLLGEKYSEFSSLFNELLAEGEPVEEAAEKSLESIDEVLSHDEVKDQEAVSDEVEDEDHAADEAIEEEEKIGDTPADDFDPESLAMAGEPGQTQPDAPEESAEEVAEEPAAPEAVESGVAEEDAETESESPADEAFVDPSLFDDAEIVSVTLDEPDEHEVPNEPQAEEEHVTDNVPVSEPLNGSNPDMPEVKDAAPAPAPEENMRVDEMLTRRSAEDLKRAFTLNDKFRFRRELFSQNDDTFRETLAVLNEMTSFDEARGYVMSKFATLDNEETIADFLAIIKPHYI